MGFAEADTARRPGRLRLDERRAEVIDGFARSHGDDARDVAHYVDHVWESDPWSGGCHGAFAPSGLWTSVGHVIREPVGRLH